MPSTIKETSKVTVGLVIIMMGIVFWVGVTYAMVQGHEKTLNNYEEFQKQVITDLATIKQILKHRQ